MISAGEHAITCSIELFIPATKVVIKGTQALFDIIRMMVATCQSAPCSSTVERPFVTVDLIRGRHEFDSHRGDMLSFSIPFSWDV
jgi:hypothetical protein